LIENFSRKRSNSRQKGFSPRSSFSTPEFTVLQAAIIVLLQLLMLIGNWAEGEKSGDSARAHPLIEPVEIEVRQGLTHPILTFRIHAGFDMILTGRIRGYGSPLR
jgi:hypothetical protein